MGFSVYMSALKILSGFFFKLYNLSVPETL